MLTSSRAQIAVRAADRTASYVEPKRRVTATHAPVAPFFGATVVLFLVMWVRAVLEVFFRRPDLSGVGKVAWAIGMLATGALCERADA
jgi:hypothetical protein